MDTNTTTTAADLHTCYVCKTAPAEPVREFETGRLVRGRCDRCHEWLAEESYEQADRRCIDLR